MYDFSFEIVALDFIFEQFEGISIVAIIKRASAKFCLSSCSCCCCCWCCCCYCCCCCCCCCCWCCWYFLLSHLSPRETAQKFKHLTFKVSSPNGFRKPATLGKTFANGAALWILGVFSSTKISPFSSP